MNSPTVASARTIVAPTRTFVAFTESLRLLVGRFSRKACRRDLLLRRGELSLSCLRLIGRDQRLHPCRLLQHGSPLPCWDRWL